MGASDIWSVQAMQSNGAAAGRGHWSGPCIPGGPVMVAYDRWMAVRRRSVAADLRPMFTDDDLSRVTADGLLAWSLMDSGAVSTLATTSALAEDALLRPTAPWIVYCPARGR